MQKFLLYPISGALVFIGVICATLFFSVVILITSIFIFIVPIKQWRQTILKHLQIIPTCWMTTLKYILSLSTHNKWIINGANTLSTKESYLLISNHASWVDIFVLGLVFNHKAPMLKFFMKKELLWQLPFAGIACWVLGYPFMERHTAAQIKKNPALKGKDIETTRNACDKMKKTPTTLMNFVEGTRFSSEKKQRQHSPYQHLLKPKAGGLAIVIEEMHDILSGIINVTICYSDKPMTFWKFISGDFGSITVNYELIPIDDTLIGDYYSDRTYRRDIQKWLNAVWVKKDNQIHTLQSEYDQQ